MSYPALDPILLQAFIAVADRLSFSRAAVALNRTQSTISAQIKRLEEQTGLRLINRSTTRVALSPAGESLIGYARQILALGEEAVLKLHAHEIGGHVRIGVMDDYGAAVLPPILKSFAVSHPNVDIQMETGLTSGMIDRIGPDFDLVIAMHALNESRGALLCRVRPAWAGAAWFDVRGARPLPLALYPSGCLFRKSALEALDRCGLAWRLAYVSHSLSVVEALANQGLAITVVKASLLPASLRKFGADVGLPQLPCFEIRLHMADAASSAAKLLATHIQDCWRLPDSDPEFVKRYQLTGS